MRWIFFSLLAANLGIFIWWQTSHPQPQKSVHTYTTPVGVGPIVLLSEAKSAAPTPEQAPAPATVEVPATAAEESRPAEVSGTEPVPPAPVVPADTEHPPASPQVAPAAENVAVSHAQCVLVGPYENNDLAQQALQKLQAKEINARLYQMEIGVPSGYQVYLDGFENRAQAKKRLDELHAIGVDSFIVPKGEFINTIALGSFDQESAAKNQIDKFAAQGIGAKVRESKRPAVEIWLALPPESGDTLPDPLRQTLDVGKGDKRKEERQILCSTIASGKNIL